MELDKILKDNQNIDKFEKFIKNPIYSTLISIIESIPVLGVLTDEIIKNGVSEYQKSKRKQLIDFINNSENLVYSDDVNNVEFLINFSKTLEAIDRLSSNKKIKYFSNLIKNTYLKSEKIDPSLYDEFLDILSRLSYREINLLSEVYLYEKTLNEYSEFCWSNLYNIISVNTGYEIEEVKSIFMRLQGKGLMYAEIEIDYITTKESSTEKKGTTKYSKKFIGVINDFQ